AARFDLPVLQVVQPPAGTDWRGFVGDGIAVNSAHGQLSLDGLPTSEAKKKIIDWLESHRLGKSAVNYKLRDWVFCRQRYWGEPFPFVWRKDSAGHEYHEALPVSELPLVPPELDDFKPIPGDQPPLARAEQ